MSGGTIHASTVAFGPEGGVLIEGPSGSGKSRLALMLIERGAELVADDRTVLIGDGTQVFARAPRAIAGMIETRGFGLVHLAIRRLARVRLVVGLGCGPAARLPEAATCQRLGRDIAWLQAEATEALARALAWHLRGAAFPPPPA